jgi:hypothetical protein
MRETYTENGNEGRNGDAAKQWTRIAIHDGYVWLTLARHVG